MTSAESVSRGQKLILSQNLSHNLSHLRNEQDAEPIDIGMVDDSPTQKRKRELNYTSQGIRPQESWGSLPSGAAGPGAMNNSAQFKTAGACKKRRNFEKYDIEKHHQWNTQMDLANSVAPMQGEAHDVSERSGNGTSDPSRVKSVLIQDIITSQ